jgi:hypothetical protein
MLHLQGDCYVVANDFKENIYINIRNYCTKGSKKYPTKLGVCLTLSRWLALKTKKDDIDSKVRKGLKGQLMTPSFLLCSKSLSIKFLNNLDSRFDQSHSELL